MTISYETQEHKKQQKLYDVYTNEELKQFNYDPDEINAHAKNKNKTSEGETKMGYNAKNGEEGKGSNLPKDDILTGVITKIDDGVVKDFIPESAREGWKGDINSPAININTEVVVETDGKKEAVNLTQMFTYFLDGDKTVYTSRSNLGKYHKKYGKLPEVGDQVKVITDDNGYGKVKLE